MDPPAPIEHASSQIPPAERELLAGAERRIVRALWLLAIVGTPLCWLLRDWRWAAGFAIGAVLSGLNFSWMKAGVQAMADAASPASGESVSTLRARPSTVGVVARFVLRYALIGAVGYAIFKSSLVSLTAFFLGLLLIVLAILAEMAYQVVCAFRKV